jgi:acylphosphatase
VEAAGKDTVSTAPTVARRLCIHGLVQGVWYRASMQREARRLGVAGWARNRADGTVEAVVEGTPQAVACILAWCAQGPSAARVERVVAEETSATGACGFEIHG